MKKSCVNFIFIAGFFFIATSCSSVFTGGTNGKVVDAESASSPKEGIADVQVYVYTNVNTRNADYEKWRSSNRKSDFSPSSDSGFVGHASTATDGSFTLSKIVWEKFFPEFGKTADSCEIFMLFYHPEYSLTKNSSNVTVISDSTSAYIMQELKKTHKTTNVDLEIRNAADSSLMTSPVTARITVPQGDGTNVVYEQAVTGNATIPIRYPRESNFEPEISVEIDSGIDGGGYPNWHICHFDTTTPNYAFYAENEKFTQKVGGLTTSVKIYLKKVKLSLPRMSGRYGTGTDSHPTYGDETANGCLVEVDGFAAGSVYTRQEIIASGQQTVIRNGVFENLGAGISFYADDSDPYYTDLYFTKDITVKVGGASKSISVKCGSDNDTLDVGVIK